MSSPTAADAPVAVLGAGGIMGLRIARNLARAGFEVRAWNRSREKAEPLARDGATVLDDAGEAVDGSATVLTILSGDEVTLQLMGDRVLDALADDARWVQMGTIGIEGTEHCATLAGKRGIEFLDAPVLGTREPAEKGELVVLASGPEAARPAVEPLFEPIAKRVMWVGEAGAGTRLKLVANFWILSIVETLAETLALAEGIDVDPRMFLEAIEGGPLHAPYATIKGTAMIEREFEPSMKLGLAAKDAALIDEAARYFDLDLPLTAVIRERLEQGARSHGDEDMAATFRTSVPAS